MYKHIVFDVDGTLINTEYAVVHSLQETHHHAGPGHHRSVKAKQDHADHGKNDVCPRDPEDL